MLRIGREINIVLMLIIISSVGGICDDQTDQCKMKQLDLEMAKDKLDFYKDIVINDIKMLMNSINHGDMGDIGKWLAKLNSDLGYYNNAKEEYNKMKATADAACKCKNTKMHEGRGGTLRIQSIAGPNQNIVLKSNISAVMFFLSAEKEGLTLELHSPDGTSITPTSKDPLIYYRKVNTTEYYLIRNPDPGIWIMEVRPFWTDEESYSLLSYKFENGIEATFNDHYSDRGIDDDRNGLHDHIDVAVGINVKSSGWYAVSGLLCNDNKNETIFAVNKTYLEQGNRSEILRFYGMRYPGSYYLKNLTLENIQPPKYANASENEWTPLLEYAEDHLEGDCGLQDFRAGAYKTNPYDKLDWPINDPWSTGMIGAYSDHGVDINGDGMYEVLTVDVGVNIAERGKYILTGDLYDCNKSEVAWSIDTGNFEPGRRTMRLNFDGTTIQKHRANGPYLLGNLSLWEENWSLMDTNPKAYSTSTYNNSDFENQSRSP